MQGYLCIWERVVIVGDAVENYGCVGNYKPALGFCFSVKHTHPVVVENGESPQQLRLVLLFANTLNFVGEPSEPSTLGPVNISSLVFFAWRGKWWPK